MPHHMALGDPVTHQTRTEYISNCDTYKAQLRAHRIEVEAHALVEALPRCVTVQQGIGALRALRRFLERDDHLAITDVSAAMRRVRRTVLPFERLVPDLDYNAVKVSLSRVLEDEIARRKRAEAAEAAARARAREAPERRAVRMPRRPNSTPGRPGLLTFYGSFGLYKEAASHAADNNENERPIS